MVSRTATAPLDRLKLLFQVGVMQLATASRAAVNGCPRWLRGAAKGPMGQRRGVVVLRRRSDEGRMAGMVIISCVWRPDDGWQVDNSSSRRFTGIVQGLKSIYYEGTLHKAGQTLPLRSAMSCMRCAPALRRGSSAAVAPCRPTLRR